ncbi:MAG: DUF1841 family protein [Burkholderiales bacterium]|nr:DUF1841 family protein [Burkholderiales bacterium]
MFQPTREQARKFFFDTWRQYREGTALSALQRMALEVMLLHPEYQALLDDPDAYLEQDYTPESGSMNPFLHLSLHLAIDEQLSIDRPPGVRAAFERLLTIAGDRHHALHALLDCLGEALWQAQRLGEAPDERMYMECVRRHIQT